MLKSTNDMLQSFNRVDTGDPTLTVHGETANEDAWVAHIIYPYLHAVHVRVNVDTFHSQACMRFELSGCAGEGVFTLVMTATFLTSTSNFLDDVKEWSGLFF